MTESEKQRLDWHSGFEGGLMLSLRAYAKDIEVEREHPLSSEPLRIDYLVIKKRHDVYVDNAIGRDYRTYNIIEYKNPNDELNVDVLWKVIGYTCIFKSLGKTVDEIKASEITISIFRAAKPVKLFKYLREKGVRVEEQDPGVHKVYGMIDIPISIVVISELRDSSLKALSVMRKKADEDTVRQFLEEASKYTEPGDKRFADAVLQISTMSNKELYDKLKGDTSMCEALRELMADELKDAENKGVELGIEQGIEQRDFDKISDMLRRGKKPEEIAEFCDYPLDQILDVQNKLNNPNG